MPLDRDVCSPADIRALFAYNPNTGVITRLASKRTDTIGPVRPLTNGNGYLVVYAMGRLFRAHRIAWVLMTGEWPTHDIDHINRDRTDNRWVNLREATRGQNLRNAGIKKSSGTGLKGVAAHGERFAAYIRLNGKKKHLGVFDTAVEAHQEYCRVSRQHFGEYASPATSNQKEAA